VLGYLRDWHLSVLNPKQAEAAAVEPNPLPSMNAHHQRQRLYEIGQPTVTGGRMTDTLNRTPANKNRARLDFVYPMLQPHASGLLHTLLR
jgi:hypothetical protein